MGQGLNFTLNPKLRGQDFSISLQLHRGLVKSSGFRVFTLHPIVVPFGGSYLESYKVIPKRNHYGASGLDPKP